MQQLDLDTAFAGDGIPHISFWNGRVLTAEDLRDEQRANQLGRHQLGRAIGPGVVEGFGVARAGVPARVTVGAGLAVDRLGQPVELHVNVELSLVVPPGEAAGGDGTFTVCDPVTSNAPTGTGLYLLVVRPATVDVASVAGVPAFGSGVATECGPRYVVDGLSFRLVGLDGEALATAAGHDQADRSALAGLGAAVEHPLARNVLAHLMLDTVAWAQRFAAPFEVPSGEVDFGVLADLVETTLLPCEVPIALLTWSFSDVGFVDAWSVRRPPSTEPALSAVQGLGSARRERTGRAGYAQFQGHLADLLASLEPLGRVQFRLPQRFRYLPAAGLVPLSRSGRTGFSSQVLDGLVVRSPVTIEPSLVGPLLDESFHHPPIDVTTGELVFVYQVLAPGGNAVDHLVFCTSRVPFRGQELTIDAVFPAGPLVLGQVIEIRGRNLGFSDGSARVEFDGVDATPRSASTDTRLVVQVPTNLPVAAGGTTVGLEVKGNAGSDSIPVEVRRPDLDPTGVPVVQYRGIKPTKIGVGEPAVVTYRVRSEVTKPVEVELRLDPNRSTRSVVDVASLLDLAGKPLDAPVRMETGDELEVEVVIDRVPDLAKFTLVMQARVAGHPDLVGEDIRAFSTGKVITEPDRGSLIRIPVDIDVPGAILRGNRLTVIERSVVNLEFEVEVTEPGDYLVDLDDEALPAEWFAQLEQPATGLFKRAQRDDRLPVLVTVAHKAGTPDVSSFQLVVRRADAEVDARVTVQLVVA